MKKYDLKGRIDAEDDIQLDLSKDACECARQILSNICKKQGLTEGKKFGYLNAFVNLRVALVHDSAQVRAAALRALRYLMKEERDVRTLNRLQYPFLIARSLDVNLRNDMERIQALRLIRRLLVLSPADFPPALTRSLVALANGGAEEKDRMLRACLGVLTEICELSDSRVLFIKT
uniref:Rapamycin-insensitive companion of mTOR N-terminal domain-containing protein n=1 Tax=Timema cristinae TaxID=61476 RepID=A0A7R9H231_TIMCR|nr:unnamed protein product [Timema cristinae]